MGWSENGTNADSIQFLVLSANEKAQVENNIECALANRHYGIIVRDTRSQANQRLVQRVHIKPET